MDSTDNEKLKAPENFRGKKDLLAPVEEIWDGSPLEELGRKKLYFLAQVAAKSKENFCSDYELRHGRDDSKERTLLREIQNGLKKKNFVLGSKVEFPEGFPKSLEKDGVEQELREYFDVPKPKIKIPKILNGNPAVLLPVDDLDLTHRGLNAQEASKAKAEFKEQGVHYVGQAVSIKENEFGWTAYHRNPYHRSSGLSARASEAVRGALKDYSLDFSMIPEGALDERKKDNQEIVKDKISALFNVPKDALLPPPLNRMLTQEDKNLQKSLDHKNAIYVPISDEFLSASIKKIPDLERKVTAAAYEPVKTVLKESLIEFVENFSPDSAPAREIQGKPKGHAIRVGIHSMFEAAVRSVPDLEKRAIQAGYKAVYETAEKNIQDYLETLKPSSPR